MFYHNQHQIISHVHTLYMYCSQISDAKLVDQTLLSCEGPGLALMTVTK